ncbi:MAG: TetR/AcrR family transcriptional regulator [Spirochaetia bacterium]|jgi:AcrR family transcriptional regulator|nr:TetR/AcrR family transcriptional regulator [Spirochaetia bacterium]
MAMKTFDNLPEERRSVILDRCFKEFAQKGYEGASIAAIIEDLGLARGSFYRYFEDKKDLYRSLYKRALDLSLEIFADNKANGQADYLDAWKDRFIAAVEQAEDIPSFLSFLTRAAQERRPEIFLNPETRGFEKRVGCVEAQFAAQARQGRIRRDVAPGLMALVFMHGRYAIGEYLQQGLREDGIKPGSAEFRKMLEKTVNEYIELIRHGIAGGGQ